MSVPSTKFNRFLVTIGLVVLILLAFSLSGFTIVNMTATEAIYLTGPNLEKETQDQVNIIQNGGFDASTHCSRSSRCVTFNEK